MNFQLGLLLFDKAFTHTRKHKLENSTSIKIVSEFHSEMCLQRVTNTSLSGTLNYQRNDYIGNESLYIRHLTNITYDSFERICNKRVAMHFLDTILKALVPKTYRDSS